MDNFERKRNWKKSFFVPSVAGIFASIASSLHFHLLHYYKIEVAGSYSLLEYSFYGLFALGGFVFIVWMQERVRNYYKYTTLFILIVFISLVYDYFLNNKDFSLLIWLIG